LTLEEIRNGLVELGAKLQNEQRNSFLATNVNLIGKAIGPASVEMIAGQPTQFSFLVYHQIDGPMDIEEFINQAIGIRAVLTKKYGEPSVVNHEDPNTSHLQDIWEKDDYRITLDQVVKDLAIFIHYKSKDLVPAVPGLKPGVIYEYWPDRSCTDSSSDSSSDEMCVSAATAKKLCEAASGWTKNVLTMLTVLGFDDEEKAFVRTGGKLIGGDTYWRNDACYSGFSVTGILRGTSTTLKFHNKVYMFVINKEGEVLVHYIEPLGSLQR